MTPDVARLHEWLCEISPMIWRRLLVRTDNTIADFDHTLQIAMGWVMPTCIASVSVEKTMASAASAA